MSDGSVDTEVERWPPVNYVGCPDQVSHRDHIFALRRTWRSFHRIVLGRGYLHRVEEMEDWCGAQPSRFYHSFAGEVWYFDDLKTAIYFKLRWHD